MSERYGVAIKVLSRQGTCVHGHEVGQEWVSWGKTPEGICIAAFDVMLPYIMLLRLGASFEGDGGDVVSVGCPDYANLTVFEMRRIRE